MLGKSDLEKLGIEVEEFEWTEVEVESGEQAIRRERIVSDQMGIVGLIVLVLGLFAFFLAPSPSSAYVNLWKSIACGGLIGAGVFFILLSLFKKRKLRVEE